MFKQMKHFVLFAFLAFGIIFSLSACAQNDKQEAKQDDNNTQTEANAKDDIVLKDNITLSAIRGHVRDNVEFTVNDLDANKDYQLSWIAIDGSYTIENQYAIVGPEFTENEIALAEGTTNEEGVWTGSFDVPEGFGGDYTVYVKDGDDKIGQVGYTIDPTFSMSPESGPAGSEITIKVEGLGWSTYMRNWQLTYDNKYTGLVTAISTNGTAEAKIRAAGTPGKHVIRLRTGYLGSPYINYQQSPYPDKPAPEFVYEVTDEVPLTENYVEETPVAADGGAAMPELVNKDGVEIVLDKSEGVVGEPVQLTASGLPSNKDIEVVFNTMRGSRVSGLGFDEDSLSLGTAITNADGELVFDFEVPDDLGGIPHRIDLKVGDEVYGQDYLRILPSIVEISPKSGPVGTKINITIKGGGWTEFDNAYYVTYDNAYNGYLCAFNSNGTLTFDVVATGEPGYHPIDLYPGIYKQEIKDTDMTLIPQLTYSTDHPGSAMPAIRLGFTVTE